MDAWLNSIPWGSITPPAVLLLVVVLILTDRLVPKKRLEEQVAACEERVTHERSEKEFYRDLALERSAQIAALLPSVETSTRMIEAMVKASKADAGDEA